MLKKFALILIFLLVALQFIRPPKNQSTAPADNDIGMVYSIPAEVHGILKQKCYDCHSNNTRYPWYSAIQPAGWWMYKHIRDGKRELNFSEFRTYPARKAAHKLEETIELVQQKEMPLKSYLWMHPEARVSPEEEEKLVAWVRSLGVGK
ncbi:MAG: heme-binding protein [Cyclobacteriaceae bacterium]|nr:MAG: heme-binding protein [Cyclobacteriaceae bacterium]